MKHLTTICAICVIALLTCPALGHVRLDRAEPKVGSTVTASPAEVKIWFTDEVDLSGTSVEVQDAAGNRVDKQDLHAETNDKSVVVVSVPAQLAAGKYKVVWHALCLDGHTTKGEFGFEVKPKS